MKFSSYCIVLVLTFAIFSCTVEPERVHPFEAYLNGPHPAYEYELKSTIEGDNYTAYVIRMVSQEWLTEGLVNETAWWHWLTIVVPGQVDHTTGMLWIGSGSSESDRPETPHPIIRNPALTTNSITAFLHNVPYQPITFQDDEQIGHQRYEDDLIAYGWRKYLEGGAEDEDAEWLSRLPMTAAAMRAMDTITEFYRMKRAMQ